MLQILLISFQFSLITPTLILELQENMLANNNDWKNIDNTPFTSLHTCSESKIGPFLGFQQQNIFKQFFGIAPHYSLTISVDIYFTEYWGIIGNYYTVFLDDNQIGNYNDIQTTAFYAPSSYCASNDILGIPRNQQLITALSTMSHQNPYLTIYFNGSFNCVLLLPLQQFCERIGIKNLHLYIEECHESCLTCTGPLETNCLTCPQGVVTLGQCSCGTLFVSKNQCVASCSANEEVVSGYCVESCGVNCLVCLNQICTSCQVDYQLYQGKCLISCPSYSVANGTNCDDLTTISSFGSEYLGKYFYTLENNIVDDLAPFTFISSSGNSLLTGQKYCIYRDLFILGGLGVWADGIFQISFSALSPHNTVRIQMKLYFIDSWNGEEFVIRVDGVQVYSKTVVSTSQSLNLMFRDAKDLIEPVTLTLSHLSSNLMIEFESKLTQSAFIASAGITDLFILIDYCEISCAVCGTSSCTLCLSPYTLIANKCVICGSANFRNSNCSCMDGYFDDLQINCQQCPNQCNGCTSLTNCINCNTSGHFANLPHCTGCELGYYYATSNDCLQCISNCVLCDNSDTCFQCQEGFYQNSSYICIECSQNCKSCNLSGCSVCESNFALNIELKCVKCSINETVIAGYCQQCQSKCLTCLDQLDNCLSCPFPRIYPPNCECQDGYFESSGQCLHCHQQCATCELIMTNCITCAANRVNAPQCDCPPGGISQIENGIVQCSGCENAYLNIVFTNDLNYILVQLGQELSYQGMLDCSLIFTQNTLNNLGILPLCLIEKSELKIQIGNEATITNNHKLNLQQPSILKFKQCTNSIQTFLNQNIYGPQVLNLPQILFSQQSITLNRYQSFTLNIIRQQINGMRQLKLDEWKLNNQAQEHSNIQQVLQSLNSQLKQQSITFQPQTQQFNSTNITLLFHNFLNVYNQIELELKYILDNNECLIAEITNLKQTFFIHNQYTFVINPKIYNNQSILSGNNSIMIYVQLIISLQKVILIQENYQTQLNSFLVTQIDTTSLETSKIYDLQFDIQSENNLSYSQSQVLTVRTQVPSIQILGGNQKIGYMQNIKIKALVSQNRLQLNETEINNMKLQIFWSCSTLNGNVPCTNQLNETIQFNNSFTVQIESYTFSPYEAVQFIVVLKTNESYQQDSIVILIVEDMVPYLELDQVNLQNYINLYDQNILRFSYSDMYINPDLLMYVGTFYENTTIISQKQYSYFEIKFCLWDFNFDRLSNIRFRFTVYNPNYLMTSSYQLQLKINQPPQECQIVIKPNNEPVTINYYSITILGCIDEDQPMQYKFVLYYTSDDYGFDTLQNNIEKGLILQDFDYNNIYEGYLMGKESSVILVMVLDGLQGISNFTQKIEINQNGYQDFELNEIFQFEKKQIQSNNNCLKQIIKTIEENNQQQMNNQLLKEILDFVQTINSTNRNVIININLIQTRLYYLLQDKSSPNLLGRIFSNSYNILVDQYLTINSIIKDKSQQNSKNQLQLKLILEQQSIIAETLNILYQCNQGQKYSNTRMLLEEDIINQNNEIYIHSTQQIANNSLQMAVINGEQFTLNQSEYQVKTQKYSQKALDAEYGSITNQSTAYSSTSVIYSTNPYRESQQFKNIATSQKSYQLYQQNLSTLPENQLLIDINNPIEYKFQINSSEELIYQCVNKLDDQWSQDTCQQESVEKQIVCRCNKVTPTTIIEALSQIQESILDLFSIDTLNRIQHYKYTTSMFIYVIFVETIIYIWYAYRGYLKDKQFVNVNAVKNNQIVPIKDQIDQSAKMNLPNLQITESIRVDEDTYVKKYSQFSSSRRQTSQQQSPNSGRNMKKSRSIHYFKHLQQQKKTLEIDSIEEGDKGSHTNTPASIIRVKTESIAINSNLSKQLELTLNRNNQQTQQKSFASYLMYFHKLVGAYYRYEEFNPRISRITIIYISVLGQMSLSTFFGQIININTILALSILQSVFSFIFKNILSFTIKSQYKVLNLIGFNLALISVSLFYFAILASITKYENVSIATLWCIIYLSNMVMDFAIYGITIQYCQFVMLNYFSKSNQFLKFAKLLLSESEYKFFYGNESISDLTQTNSEQQQQLEQLQQQIK